MGHSFYLPPQQWGSTCTLEGPEAKHLTQALRIKVGEEVRLLDGAGRRGVFRVSSLNKRAVALALCSEEYLAPPSSLPIMALAWSKATRRGFFMEKAVELGVHQVWLWQGDHSQGHVPADVKESWQGQMIAAVKQSNNPWLPTVQVLPGGAKDLAGLAAGADHKMLPYEMQEHVPMLTPHMAGRPGVSVYVIGPEGGFSARELAVFDREGFCPVSLGARVLRCETAALLCLGIHWWASHLGAGQDGAARPPSQGEDA